MDIEVTPKVVVDLRDGARSRSWRDEPIDATSLATDNLSAKPARAAGKDRVALWYGRLELADGLEGMYFSG